MAGRIPQTFINEMLARADIVDIIERRITLKKSGKNYSACCPFHNEKTPSFSVSPDKQFYYCFGCGASGNALTFIMEYEGQEFVAAIEDLAQTMGLEVPRESFDGPKAPSHEHLYRLMSDVSAHYQHQLKNNPAAKSAIDYLKKRGLSGEVAKRYGIGYAPDEWQNLLKLKTDSDDLTLDLIDTGMMIKNDKGHTYDRFRDRVMFPIRNRRGHTIGFGGRIIDNGEPKYLNSPETKLFHKGQELYGLYEMRKELRSIKQVLIVEGYMDVVALAQFGINNATATLGTATSSEHLQTLFRLCSKVVFCFDGDKAGKAAALRALQNALPLMREAREIRIMFLPDGEDPDSMVRKVGADSFKHEVEQAITLFDYLIEHLTAQVDMNTFEGPARLIHLAKPFSQAIIDPILKTRFDQKLAHLAGLTELQVAQATEGKPAETKVPNYESSSKVIKTRSSDPASRNKPAAVAEVPSKTPFRRAIALLLQQPDALPAADIGWIKEVDEPGAAIFHQIATIISNNDAATTGMLIENWRGQAEEVHLIKLANMDLIINSEQIPAELADILCRLEKEMVIDKWDQLIEKSKVHPLTPEEKTRLKALQLQMLNRG
jgi:DNA primase